jgi:hypothetical protein
VVLALADRERVLGQRRTLRHGARRAFGHATELGDALGNQVDVLLDGLVDLVEELVERDELRPLHVPMRLLAHRLEVDAVSEPLVEEPDDLGACGRREVVFRREETRSVGSIAGPNARSSRHR